MEQQPNNKPRGTLPPKKFSFAQFSAYLSLAFVTFMVVTHSNRNIIGKQKQMMTTPANSRVNYIYDPDHGLNMSHVCLSAKNVHQTKYKDSPCVNKTFIGWYNPWARHHSWKKFWMGKDEKRRQKQEVEEGKDMKQEVKRSEIETKTEKETEKVIEMAEEPEDSPKPLSTDKEKKQKMSEEKELARKKEKEIQFLYAILIALLMMSTLAACWEVAKERLAKNEMAEKKAQEDRQCTLANFTINRHLRRESQQQNSSSIQRQGSLEQKSKVTQTFIHQSSLDRTFPMTTSEALNPRTERRYSIPAGLLSDGNTANRVPAVSQQLIQVQRLSSIDGMLEDSNLDGRKKPRHFIRRH